MEKSIFQGYFRPFPDYGGISAERAFLRGFLAINCSAISVHIIIHIIVGSQSIFVHSDNSCLSTKVCRTLRVQVVQVVPIRRHLVVITQIKAFWPRSGRSTSWQFIDVYNYIIINFYTHPSYGFGGLITWQHCACYFQSETCKFVILIHH